MSSRTRKEQAIVDSLRQSKWIALMESSTTDTWVHIPVEKYLGRRTGFTIAKFICDSGKSNDFDWHSASDGGLIIRKAKPYRQAK